VSVWPLSVPNLSFLPGLHIHVLSYFIFQSLGLYIFAVDGSQSDSTDLRKVVFVQPFAGPMVTNSHDLSCMQLTDRRVYFTWDNTRRRNVPLFKDEESTLDLSSHGAPGTVEKLDETQLTLFGMHHHL
jgi:hypothetical protein